MGAFFLVILQRGRHKTWPAAVGFLTGCLLPNGKGMEEGDGRGEGSPGKELVWDGFEGVGSRQLSLRNSRPALQETDFISCK